MKKVFVVAHAPTSVQRLEDLAKLAFGFGEPVSGLVVTKPSGAAAQIGVPEVSKLAYKLDKAFFVFPDIDDALELLKPQRVYTVSREYGEEVERVEAEGVTLVVVGASEPGLSKLEASKGKAIYPKGLEGEIGPIGAAALILAGLK
ncbi:RecB-family nuclease [Ignicoccus hospitalis]|uniref:RecB-family nuclease-like protein n=1 Tax=Ignicoccus hospitalis (strain KIN4/I / DSM 18386 / JCM 14125) TaxID=453591 RepID=A8A923_IGNH4|nr:RecB-family nuclease [Ignicoccus hospitalis]ABU81425.1 RecB-family nuclease-like protein [Ignicoccus hospitalis KIN4/I]HIH90268.1 exonuclease [Desulfurococcaceae archaeon]